MPRPAHSHHNAAELEAIRRAIPPGTNYSVRQTLLALLLIRAARRPRTTPATLIAATLAAARYHHAISHLIRHILGLNHPSTPPTASRQPRAPTPGTTRPLRGSSPKAPPAAAQTARHGRLPPPPWSQSDSPSVTTR